jgi:hypothetical protein
MTAESAPAPRKSNKTALIIVSSLVGVVLLCVVLNLIGNNATGGIAPTPTVLPTLDMTPVMERVGTAFTNFFGSDIATTSGQVQSLGCGQYVGRKLVLPSGESAFVPCPADSASVSLIGADMLPGSLDAGLTFISGMGVVVLPSVASGQYKVTVHFVIPAGYAIDKLTILHWDGAKWQDLGPLQTPDGGASTGGLFVLAGK